MGVKVKNEDAACTDLRVWTVIVEGASTTLYEGEKFTLQFRFDEQYPFSSPEVIFFFYFTFILASRNFWFLYIKKKIDIWEKF